MRGDADERASVVAAYLSHTDRVDGSDLVDASAPGVLGAHLLRDAAGRDVLDVLAGSSSVWERRIAVVATLALVRAGEPEDTLRLALALAGDEHDLVRKAVGWTLHEVGRHDAPRRAAPSGVPGRARRGAAGGRAPASGAACAEREWAEPGSNRRPSRCKRDALTN